MGDSRFLGFFGGGDHWPLVINHPPFFISRRRAAELGTGAALLLAGHLRIHACDAYFFQCALEAKCPLLTLDRGMRRVAKELSIKLVE